MTSNSASMTRVELGRLYLYAADALYHNGDHPAALERSTSAINEFKNSDAHSLYGRAKCRRGYTSLSLGRGPEAADDFREARFAFKRIDDLRGELDACNSLARCAFIEGQYEKAKTYLVRSIGLAVKLGDKPRYAPLNPNLGRVLALLGEFQPARQCLEIKTEIFGFNTPANQCRQFLSLAYTLIQLRDYRRTVENLDYALKMANSNSLPRELCIYHEYAGELCFWQDDYDKAEEHYREAIKIGEEIAPDGDIISQSCRLLAELQVARNQLDDAEESCNRGWTVAEKITERLELGAIQRTRGEIAARRGDADIARTAFDAAIRILSEIGAKYELARAYLQSGETEVFDNDYRRFNLGIALWLFKRIGVEYWQKHTADALDRLTRGAVLCAISTRSRSNNDKADGPFIAASAPMKKVLDLVAKVKDTNATILLLGETGVGKDHLARHLHYSSNRADKPFENVAAANFPAELWAAEFFGHEKNAFTNAGEAKEGVLERANGGTVYLNEISEVPLDFQLKMLHFLESKEVTRLGGSKRIALDIRFVAASNKNLLEEVDACRFRRDLYYRLNQMPVAIPPLRERRGDIRDLARHFLTLYDYPPQKIRHLLDSPFYDLLHTAAWPGNVRQLEHVLRRLTILANGADPEAMLQIAREVLAEEKLLPDPEREKLLGLLEANNWNQRETARQLGMSDSNLRFKMKSMKIIRPPEN